MPKILRWVIAIVLVVGVLGFFLWPLSNTPPNPYITTSNGRQVFLALYNQAVSSFWNKDGASNNDRLYGSSDVWPKEGQYRSTTEFFKAMVSNDWISGVDYSFFSAPGLPLPSDPSDPAKFTSDNNAWCIAALPPDAQSDVLSNPTAHVPFMFTKNIGFGDPPRPAWPGATIADMTGLIRGTPPFSDKFAVIVTYSGAVKVLPSLHATQTNFNPKGYTLKVLPP